MPYVEYLFCDECGSNNARLDLDFMATIEAYNEEGRQNSVISPATIVWDYLIYSCDICQKKFKYTYRDVERKVREYFSSFSEEHREYFDRVVEQAENGQPIHDIKHKSKARDRYTAE